MKPKITYETMSKGQLVIAYVAKCDWHGCSAARALDAAMAAQEPKLREALIDYGEAAAREDWQAAEDALLSVPDATQASKVP